MPAEKGLFGAVASLRVGKHRPVPGNALRGPEKGRKGRNGAGFIRGHTARKGYPLFFSRIGGGLQLSGSSKPGSAVVSYNVPFSA